MSRSPPGVPLLFSESRLLWEQSPPVSQYLLLIQAARTLSVQLAACRAAWWTGGTHKPTAKCGLGWPPNVHYWG